MRFSKYNHEGYHDPTVYEAFTGIEKERKQEKQAVKQLRASYAVYRPIVYICSPYAGDVKQNVRRAQAYCRFAVQKNCVPIATHLLFPQFMEDSDPEQAAMMFICKRLKLNYKKLSEEEKKWLKKISEKSDLLKNPNPQRGKRG